MAGLLAVVVVRAADAQIPSNRSRTAMTQSGQTSTSMRTDLKPATTTFLGDTGLWFVPTADVLANGKWSVSGYRRGTNYIQGFSNIGDFAGTVGYGVGDRAEIFGSLLFDTRIDRDLRPIFTSDSAVGGVIDRYPRVSKGWTGDHIGDLYVGAKVAAVPQLFAIRAIVKVPTGDDDAGVSTGKTDLLIDAVASHELKDVVTVSGFAGYEWRGTPDGLEAPGGAFRWGGGAAFPSRFPVRAELELNGIVPSADTTRFTGSPFVAVDGSVAPVETAVNNLTRATAGLTWQGSSGVFVGGGISWNVPRKNRDLYRTDSDTFADFVDWQVRIGFHPGARSSTTSSSNAVPSGENAERNAGAPSPATPPSAATPAPAPAPAPTPSAPPAPSASAVPAPPSPSQPGQREGSAQASRGPSAAEYAFDDVYFDFDRYSLRPEATRVLDGVVTAMQQNNTLRLEIEGHTCNIGTAEYNLALGERRAQSVRSYLIAHGVPEARLTTISYGEERPKYDNSREETRRMNRRAAFVISLR
jgi:outer membrane protein OmpA-like peptidoglycan-associated protein